MLAALYHGLGPEMSERERELAKRCHALTQCSLLLTVSVMGDLADTSCFRPPQWRTVSWNCKPIRAFPP